MLINFVWCRVEQQQIKLKVSESSSPGLPSNRQEVVGSKPNQVQILLFN